MNRQQFQQYLATASREFIKTDLRLSYLIIGAMVVFGALVNLVLPHGWTIWPFVLAAGILTYINEAADRNGQGLPPLKVYAFLLGALAGWLVVVMILSVVPPLIILLGLLAVAYRAAQAYFKQRERKKLIDTRLAEGRCVHCGEIYDPRSMLCESCGEEPNPDAAILQRVAGIYRSPESMARARAILTRGGPAKSAASLKEAALIARHHSGKAPPPPTLPKAAKLGGRASVSSKPK